MSNLKSERCGPDKFGEILHSCRFAITPSVSDPLGEGASDFLRIRASSSRGMRPFASQSASAEIALHFLGRCDRACVALRILRATDGSVELRASSPWESSWSRNISRAIAMCPGITASTTDRPASVMLTIVDRLSSGFGARVMLPAFFSRSI